MTEDEDDLDEIQTIKYQITINAKVEFILRQSDKL